VKLQPGARIAVAAGAVLALTGGAFTAGFLSGRPELQAEARREKTRAAATLADRARIQRERDALKAERDRLEQQLASSSDQRACPDDYVSTATSTLVAFYVAEYPCSWHVLEEPLQKPAEEAGSRSGLMVDNLFLDPLPISKAPREGPLAQIELGAWYDDPNRSPDALPKLADWIAEERKRYSKSPELKEFSTATGFRITRLIGETVPFGDPIVLVEYIWEVTDANSVRRIIQVSSYAPPASVTRALDRLVQSFRMKGA
jgi:hypothetical protein